jgi:hypothetical protein
MIDKWWSDSVAALQSSDWSAKVDAKEDLKKRVAGILKK